MNRQVKHPDVVYTDLEDGAVLLHVGTKFYYSLNDVGAVIWRLLDAEPTREDLIRRVTAAYDVDAVRAEPSVSEFLQELEREQLIVRDEDGASGMPPGASGSAGSAQAEAAPLAKKAFGKPELIKHDEPLHEVVMNPFDPQLPLAE